MIDPFGSRAFDRGNTDVLSQILGGGDAEKELLLIRQAPWWESHGKVLVDSAVLVAQKVRPPGLLSWPVPKKTCCLVVSNIFFDFPFHINGLSSKPH